MAATTNIAPDCSDEQWMELSNREAFERALQVLLAADTSC